MIEQLSIAGLGVIDRAELPLGPGFTAVTGETGAGKTMVVTALGLLLGERADSSAVRSGRSAAVVEGVWRVPLAGAVAERVRDSGGDLDEHGDGSGELLLSRSVSAEGRGRAVVGGRSAPVSVLGELAEHLVVVHGQSDQHRLRGGGAQRDALDRFAGPALSATLASYREVFERWHASQRELDELVGERDRRRREGEQLRQALDEIEQLDPQPGEDLELAQRADRLMNLEDLRLAAGQAQELVSSQAGDDTPDATVLLDSARRALERVSGLDAELPPIVEQLLTAEAAVADASASLARYLDGLDGDTSRELDEVQRRRAQLTTLLRRHGTDLAGLLAFAEQGSRRLLELDGDDDRIDALTAAVGDDDNAVRALADEVSAARREAAERLGHAVSAELAALAMPDARLVVQVERRDELTASGADAVALLLAPHPGAEPRPIARSASGGELSRVMLALEVVIAGSDPVPTFVFDEVDAGVGGASATEIGRRLARLATTSQVLVVTHLAQVAAFAGNHLRVVKDSDGEVTASSVVQLEGDARVAEMARLLSGLADSPSALAHARELLDLAAEQAAADGPAPRRRRSAARAG